MGAGGQLAGLGGSLQGLNMADVQSLQGIGGMQQFQNQQGLDIAYQDFQREDQYGRDQIRFLENLLRGETPSAMSQTQTETTEDPSTLSSIASIAGSVGCFFGGTAGEGVGNLIGSWFD